MGTHLSLCRISRSFINRRYVRLAIERIFKPVIGELRHEFGYRPIEQLEITEPELELMWSLHGSILYRHEEMGVPR